MSLSWWQPHACPVSKCNTFPLRYSGRPWHGGSSTNSSHSWKSKIFMARETGKKYILTLCRNVLCNLLGFESSLQLPQETTITPWTFISAFTDCEQRCRFGHCFCLLRGKWLPVPQLFWRKLGVWLCLSTWRYFFGLITGVWWIAYGHVQQTLLWYISDSLAVWRLLLTFHQLLKEFLHVWESNWAKTELWFRVFI